ncbi:MAG TPA: DNA repair protein RecN [Candidatus Eisenbacteria bacterium]|jgi:DNA repair protein RecN (Recombination protein N)
MLERLVIRDLALVDRAEIAFGRGLSAVTGETGAGKSLTVEALALLVGGRADADIVREGAKSCVVEAEFRLGGDAAQRVAELLDEWGLPFDGESLIVRREVSVEGRSRAAVNQSSVTLANLKRLGEQLLDLHGQHEHQSLLRDGAALATLDRLAGLEPERAKFADTLAALREAEGELARLRESLATFAERRDYLFAAAAELDEAKLREGEEDELKAEAARLAHADRLRELATLASARLSEGDGAAVDSLGAARHAIEQAVTLDPSLANALAQLAEANIAAQEAARTLADYLDSLEADPDRLEAVQARRELYARLTRKYRRPLPDLLAWREELAAGLAQGDDAEGALARAEERVVRAEAACLAAGKSLGRKRQAAAKEWSGALTHELKPLGFPHARVAFEVAPVLHGRPTRDGLDEVTLVFTANPGEPARPLAKIASGGELSRVMLALKCALQTRDRVDLLVFDEVDSGIGGAVAQAVGERLRSLAEHRQVVCVTHLPLIAALAGHHLAVSKHVAGGRTTVRVSALERNERVEELARMLAGGRVTETTRRQARELLAAPAAKA